MAVDEARHRFMQGGSDTSSQYIADKHHITLPMFPRRQCGAL